MFPRVIVPLFVVGLMVYALADVWGAEEDERGGLPRWLWVLLIVLLPLLGPISWIVVRTTSRRSAAGPVSGPGPGPGSGGSRPTPPPRPAPRRAPSGPAAPDDDPEFLWLLEQAKRKREREDRRSRDAKGDDAENN